MSFDQPVGVTAAVSSAEAVIPPTESLPTAETQLEQQANADFDRILATVPGASSLEPVPPALVAGRTDYISWYTKQPQPIPADQQANMDAIIGRQIAAALPVEMGSQPPAAENQSPIEQPATASQPEPPTAAETPQPPEAPATAEAETTPLDEARLTEIADLAARLDKFKNLDLAQPNLYDLLGIAPSKRSEEALKSAYQTKSKETHPDSFNAVTSRDKIAEIESHADQVSQALAERGLTAITIDDLRQAAELATPVFQMVSQAYEVLKNPESRQIYDWFMQYANQPLQNGLTLIQAYFVMGNDRARKAYIDRWASEYQKNAAAQREAQVKEDLKRRQAEEDARWEARQAELKQDRQRRQREEELAKKAREGPQASEVRSPFQTHEFDYANFASWAENDRFRDFLLNQYQRPRGAFTLDLIRQLRQEGMAYTVKHMADVYQAIKYRDMALRLDFADESTLFRPQQLLQELLRASWEAEYDFDLPESMSSIDQLLASQGEGQNLSELQNFVGEVVNSLRQTGGDVELIAQLNSIHSIIAQIKTVLNISQLLGLPAPLGRIVRLCNRLQGGSRAQALLKATVNEIFRGENAFV